MKRILYILMVAVAAVCLAAPQVGVPVPKPKPKPKPKPTPQVVIPKPSTRRCSQCGKKKTLDGFNGSSRICWSCTAANERNEEERQRQAVAEAVRQRQAAAEAERQRQAAAEAVRQRQAAAEAERQRFVDKTYTVNGVSFTMVAVMGGTFTMGATAEQGSDAWYAEEPDHRVTLSDYYIGKTEVTEGLWCALMGSNPSYIKRGDNYPVENVSWNDCQTFISKLNALTGETFRLPTEAEWEFAARGGTMSRGYKYSGSNTVDDVARYNGNSGSAKHPVATKAANELGLYDMSGNVWEWCQDWFASDYYGKSSSSNPTGPTTGSLRVRRGGSWFNYARYCRVSYRSSGTPSDCGNYLGFRLAR